MDGLKRIIADLETIDFPIDGVIESLRTLEQTLERSMIESWVHATESRERYLTDASYHMIVTIVARTMAHTVRTGELPLTETQHREREKRNDEMFRSIEFKLDPEAAEKLYWAVVGKEEPS